MENMMRNLLMMELKFLEKDETQQELFKLMTKSIWQHCAKVNRELNEDEARSFLDYIQQNQRVI